MSTISASTNISGIDLYTNIHKYVNNHYNILIYSIFDTYSNIRSVAPAYINIYLVSILNKYNIFLHDYVRYIIEIDTLLRQYKVVSRIPVKKCGFKIADKKSLDTIANKNTLSNQISLHTKRFILRYSEILSKFVEDAINIDTAIPTMAGMDCGNTQDNIICPNCDTLSLNITCQVCNYNIRSHRINSSIALIPYSKGDREKRENTWKEKFRRFKGEDIPKVSVDVIEHLTQEIAKHDIPLSKLTISTIKSILKEHKYKNVNKYASFYFKQITGRSVHNISSEQTTAIEAQFKVYNNALYELDLDIEPNFDYMLYQIFKHVGIECDSNDFDTIRTPIKQREHTEIIQQLAEHLNRPCYYLK